MTYPRQSEKRLDVLEEAATRALEFLTSRGVDHAEVSASEGDRLEVSVRAGETELIKEARSSGLSVRVVVDGRVAVSGTTDLEPESVEAFLARTIEMAEISEPDELAAPPDESLLVSDYQDLELFDPKSLRLDASRAIKMATQAERAAFKADRRITSSEGASVSRSVGHSVLATTGGFLGRSAGTSQYLVVQVVADDEGGKKRNGFFWSGGRFAEMLARPAAVGREAARRAVRQLGARKIETGTYPVVFDREAAGALVGLVASCVTGNAVYRDQSYLAGRLGERVASKLVTIVDDPLIPRGPGSRPYDGEGTRTRKNVVIDRGVLRTYLLDTYSARKLGLAATGSAGGGGGVPYATTSNFMLKNGRKAPERLLEGIQRGLYVTSMMGFGFNAVTGDFSRGASGFLIEDGALTIPVGEITISRNLEGLLGGVDAVANDLELRTSTASPSLRVDEMTISGS